jgi:hypothetical protein
MIEIVEGLPDNVVGLVVKGWLTNDDCAGILLLRLRKAQDVGSCCNPMLPGVRWSWRPGAVWDARVMSSKPLLRPFLP